jgi:hypothetical protein
MSKFELQQRALEGSGVSFEESQVAVQLEPSLYERLGKEKGWKQLSTLFYNRVFADTEAPHFKSIFASSTKQEAIENQVRVCVCKMRKSKNKSVESLVGWLVGWLVGLDECSLQDTHTHNSHAIVVFIDFIVLMEILSCYAVPLFCSNIWRA